MQTIKVFINKHKISATSEMVDHNPNMDGGERMDHYRVRLSRREDGKKRTLSVYFSMGPALCREPTAEDVLECLASDSSGVENAAGDFEQWCSEYGYNTDSRKAERTFRVCERQAERLKGFLGADLYDTLLWHTEN